MPSKTFHISDLLSITTGRLVSLRHIEGVYDVVDFVTGQPHWTHQLPRAADVVKPELLRQHPWLADIEPPEEFDGEGAVMEWVVEVGAEHGQWYDVEAMPEGVYVGREPVAELREMMPDKPILAVGEPPADLDGGPR